jgi:hypothetical protein
MNNKIINKDIINDQTRHHPLPVGINVWKLNGKCLNSYKFLCDLISLNALAVPKITICSHGIFYEAFMMIYFSIRAFLILV